MRVLYVIDSLISGGAETSLAHIAPGYRDVGIDLHVAFLKSRWDVADELLESGATLHPVELDERRRRQLRGLIRLIRRIRPDVLHTTLWESDVLGRLAAAATRTPVVTTFTSSNYSEAKLSRSTVSRTKIRLAQAIDIATARIAIRFQAVSEQVAHEMSNTMHVRPERIVVVPRARRRDVLGEPTPERRAATRSSLGIDVDAPVVLAIARQEHPKGLDILADATAHLRDRIPGLVVVVAGRPGRASAELDRLVRSHHLEPTFRFLGARDDVGDLIVGSDVVAVPSRVEGMPGAVLEAMALERPVVASDLPVVREAIGANAAALVPVGDSAALADALQHALTDGHAATVRSARIRFDTTFAPGPVAARLAELYREAISESRWSDARLKRAG